MNPPLFKGYTLLYAILLIIVVCSCSMLFLSYMKMGQTIVTHAQNKVTGSRYGFEALSRLADPDIGFNNAYTIEYPDDFRVFVKKLRWGCYELFSSTVITKANDTIFHRLAFAGLSNDTGDKSVLMIKNSSQFAYVAENVSIRGTCYVPGGAFKSYKGGVLPDESQSRTAPERIPPLREIDSVAIWIDEAGSGTTEPVRHLTEDLQQGFGSQCLVKSGDSITISAELSGNIIVVAKTILVKSTARLENVILVASTIFFEPAFEGRVQCYAADTIITGERAKFFYPSVLAIMDVRKYSTGSNSPLLHIADSVTFEGELYGHRKRQDGIGKPLIQISNNCRITGGIYCTGYVQIRGKINGTVICEKLLESAYHSVQENLLYNVSIDSVPVFYSFSTIYPMQSLRMKIVQWVN